MVRACPCRSGNSRESVRTALGVPGYRGSSKYVRGMRSPTITRELGTSYSLGYAPSTASDGKSHRIEVRVRRPGLVVSQSRDNYQR